MPQGFFLFLFLFTKETLLTYFMMLLQGFSKVICIKYLGKCYHLINPDIIPDEEGIILKGRNSKLSAKVSHS